MDFSVFILSFLITGLASLGTYFLGKYDGHAEGIKKGARAISDINRDLDEMLLRIEEGRKRDDDNNNNPWDSMDLPLDKEEELFPDFVPEGPVDDVPVVAKKGRKKSTKKAKKANPNTR